MTPEALAAAKQRYHTEPGFHTAVKGALQRSPYRGDQALELVTFIEECLEADRKMPRRTTPLLTPQESIHMLRGQHHRVRRPHVNSCSCGLIICPTLHILERTEGMIAEVVDL